MRGIDVWIWQSRACLLRAEGVGMDKNILDQIQSSINTVGTSCSSLRVCTKLPNSSEHCDCRSTLNFNLNSYSVPQRLFGLDPGRGSANISPRRHAVRHSLRACHLRIGRRLEVGTQQILDSGSKLVVREVCTLLCGHRSQALSRRAGESEFDFT